MKPDPTGSPVSAEAVAAASGWGERLAGEWLKAFKRGRLGGSAADPRRVLTFTILMLSRAPSFWDIASMRSWLASLVMPLSDFLFDRQ